MSSWRRVCTLSLLLPSLASSLHTVEVSSREGPARAEAQVDADAEALEDWPWSRPERNLPGHPSAPVKWRPGQKKPIPPPPAHGSTPMPFWKATSAPAARAPVRGPAPKGSPSAKASSYRRAVPLGEIVTRSKDAAGLIKDTAVIVKDALPTIIPFIKDTVHKIASVLPPPPEPIRDIDLEVYTIKQLLSEQRAQESAEELAEVESHFKNGTLPKNLRYHIDKAHAYADTSLYCKDHYQELTSDADKKVPNMLSRLFGELPDIWFVGESIFEAFMGTSCGIPLLGLCETNRKDLRGCRKEKDFRKKYIGDKAPLVLPRYESATRMQDEWNNDIPGHKIKVYASSGFRVQEVNALMAHLANPYAQPRLIFLHVGINVLLNQQENVYEYWSWMLKNVYEAYPDTWIAIHPALPCPRCKKYGVTPENIDKFNKFLAMKARDMNVGFKTDAFEIIDCGGVFKKGAIETAVRGASDVLANTNTLSIKALEDKLMPDGMHPSVKGHAMWEDCYAPKIKQLVGKHKAKYTSWPPVYYR